MVLGTDVGSDLAMPDLVPGGARRRASSGRGDGAGGLPGPRQGAADPLREPRKGHQRCALKADSSPPWKRISPTSDPSSSSSASPQAGSISSEPCQVKS